MAGSGVIADVSQALRTALTGALATLPVPPQALIHDLQTTTVPPISTNPPSLVIFLYRLIEDPSTRNRPPITEHLADRVETRKPPLTLLLQYLLTAFSGDHLTDQRILGRALEFLYDHPIFSGPDFIGVGLEGSSDILSTTFAPLTLEELTRVWHSVQRPYRLSVTYQMRVANIDANERRRGAAVRTRTLQPAEKMPS